MKTKQYRWRPVSETPEVTDPYNDGHFTSEKIILWLSKERVAVIGEYYVRLHSGQGKFRAYGFHGDFDITHWMPLPKGPDGN